MRVKKLVSFILVLSLMPVSAYAVSQSDIDAVKAKRDEVAQEKAAQQQIVDEYAVARDTVLDEKMALEQSVALAVEQISLYDQEIAMYSEMIVEKAKEVDAAKSVEDEQFSKFCKRIRAMEENGSYSILALLLNAGSYSELLSSLDDYGDVMESDKRLFNELQDAREEHQRIQQEYEDYKAECEQKQEDLRAEKAKMEEEISEKQDRIDEIQKLINENQSLLDEINARWDELNSEVDTLEARLAAQKAAATATPGSLSGYGFVWPVSSTYITSRAGYRVHPISGETKYHSGMDIAADSGSPVWAAASGTVSLAGWNGGYGYCIMIDHDNGLTTLYGHLSSIGVSVGQSVTAKQSIGAVGSTGLSTGPHLHFEIRSGGACMDPENYFPVGSFTFSSSAGE